MTYLRLTDIRILYHIANQTLASLSTVVSDIDDVATVLDKRAKEVARNTGGDGKAREKILRDLLAGM